MVFAYLDPGAGSLVIQAILAGILAIPFFLRSQLTSIVRRIRGRGADSNDQASR